VGQHRFMNYKWLIGGGAVLFVALGLCLWVTAGGKRQLLSPLGMQPVATERPYAKYTFQRLAARPFSPTNIELGTVLAETEKYTSYLFFYQSEGRRISGQLNLPKLSRTMAVIVMARGYVDKDVYATGMGTKNAASYYASQGYITLAPDFSGYGESDPEDTNALGARLVKPVEILDLISSLASLPQVDLQRVYLWGHSNGGQIMLSVAEIWGKMQKEKITIRGMVLWAPVSKPFPYNILYYTDEASDQGKWLRAQVAEFEKDYDVFEYSIDKFFAWITLPVQLHQGTADEAVPKIWSDQLVKSLKIGSNRYYTYPGANHNLTPGWEKVVARDVDFFQNTGMLE
jgi:uncharacterized protein